MSLHMPIFSEDSSLPSIGAQPVSASVLSARLLSSPSGNAKDKHALVFLHGLLGNGKDWQDVIDALGNDFTCLTIDLPGHGESQHIDVAGFDDTCVLIATTIQYHLHQPFWLIGYSLGARLAMYLSAVQRESVGEGDARLAGLIIESGHTGLPIQERAARKDHDARWAARFEQEPIVDVLQDWYQQAVFSSLNHEQKQSLVAIRSDNLGVKVASMLRATSLAKQPILSQALKNSGLPLYYLCGENDHKFAALAKYSGFAFFTIPNAGHNIHTEQPALFSQHVKRLI
ncbi:2-succinyl-6-hydroxy-2,4-cyclohexadiene-1-carboxylate synthase [Enterovibrio norvegicus FF-33]|uniref:2-succinyl-6-hydroxy-2, 4-cyclohexadiene-1-carboxylate synthase n=1 Tax=Enterovibrio norvegicus TaxID=188144 RepID=UPI00036EA8DE|nr:2-succinyl-6-hydroxy-2,4-cyclohexadiene-1-carboxylate synthase [Enterovibrio norvegicus]OEE68038.1 2-succinyl-6-hydroxy-2,4-cyclohexadiene-1-carboxylate synthase [Enterovibrio norvegicus FF-33]